MDSSMFLIRRRKLFYQYFGLHFQELLFFYIKTYIILALLPGIVMWLFTELNKTVENKTLRKVMTVITFSVGGIIAFFIS
jgi:hypothetical protein